jgi:hypothetical protein
MLSKAMHYLVLKSPNQLRLRKDMPLHRRVELFPLGIRLQIRLRLQRIHLEKIMVRWPAALRTWPCITRLPSHILPLHRPVRQVLVGRNAFRQRMRARWHIINQPMCHRAFRSVRIIHNQRECLGRRRSIPPSQRRRNIRPVATVLRRNICVRLNRRTRQLQNDACLFLLRFLSASRKTKQEAANCRDNSAFRSRNDIQRWRLQRSPLRPIWLIDFNRVPVIDVLPSLTITAF